MLLNKLSHSNINRYSVASRTMEEIHNIPEDDKNKKNITRKKILPLENAQKIYHITSKFDSLKDIPSREMVNLSKELYDNGVICLRDYQILSFQPELHPDYNEYIGQFNNTETKPDEKRNFIQIWKEKYRTQKNIGNMKGIESARGIVNILENIESINENYNIKAA